MTADIGFPGMRPPRQFENNGIGIARVAPHFHTTSHITLSTPLTRSPNHTTTHHTSVATVAQ